MEVWACEEARWPADSAWGWGQVTLPAIPRAFQFANVFLDALAGVN